MTLDFKGYLTLSAACAGVQGHAACRFWFKVRASRVRVLHVVCDCAFDMLHVALQIYRGILHGVGDPCP